MGKGKGLMYGKETEKVGEEKKDKGVGGRRGRKDVEGGERGKMLDCLEEKGKLYRK